MKTLRTQDQQVLEFVKVQFGIFVRTNGLKTKEQLRTALENNYEKWVKMYILVTNKSN